jgi:uncharacterized membrane protein
MSNKVLFFIKLFVFFILGSLFGSFFEGVILLLINKEFLIRHDLIYGPFSTLYGFGTVIFLLLLLPSNKDRVIVKTFIYSFFIGGILEYVAGLLSEIFFHIKFWDYSKMILNINGRTTIPIMILWGVMGTILVKVIYPFIEKLIYKVPSKIGFVFIVLIFIFINVDMLISYTAFYRMVLRNRGLEPKNKIGTIYDIIYNDEFMYKEFPILEGKFD